METRHPARVYPVGDYILEECEARMWSISYLAEILDWSEKRMVRVLSGAESLTGDLAEDLAAAFGTSADFWLHLHRAYDEAPRWA